jgi:predicted kinase
MPTVHLICGPLGAGKTTLARRIAGEQGALRCSLDEWVMQLFGAEAPEPMVFEWWAERCRRCRERIWSMCEVVLARRLDVVLDFGFPSVSEREEYRQRALGAGASVHLHVVLASPALRWQRVQARNRDRAETFALVVTEGMFQGSEAWWQPPTAAERAGAISFHEPDASMSS